MKREDARAQCIKNALRLCTFALNKIRAIRDAFSHHDTMM